MRKKWTRTGLVGKTERRAEYVRRFSKRYPGRYEAKLKRAQRKWLDNNHEKHLKQVDAYRKRHPEKIAARKKKWQMENREKNRAHALVAYYVKKGMLKRPKSCPACGKRTRI